MLHLSRHLFLPASIMTSLVRRMHAKVTSFGRVRKSSDANLTSRGHLACVLLTASLNQSPPLYF